MESSRSRHAKRLRYRYYTDGGYNRGGKAVCVLSNIPADALDAFVVGRVRDVLLGDDGDTADAIDGFVEAIMTRWSNGDADDTAAVDKEIDAVTRRIKQTVAMLADPAFDGLDELKTSLADMKKRRDRLQAQLKRRRPQRQPLMSEKDLRQWADDRFQRFADICDGGAPTAEARRLVHAYVDRIEIEPLAKRGTLYLPPDALPPEVELTCF